MHALLPVCQDEVGPHAANYRSHPLARALVVRNFRILIRPNLELGADCSGDFRCLAPLLPAVVFHRECWVTALAKRQVQDHDAVSTCALGTEKRAHCQLRVAGVCADCKDCSRRRLCWETT
jgi:hypothetical protein